MEENNNNKRDEESPTRNAGTLQVLRNHERNKLILNLMRVPYSGRPEVLTSYVPPTLFQFAHEILVTEPSLRGSGGHTLYLGPKTAASERALEALLQAKIVGIVNCTTRVPCFHREQVRYSQVPVQDTPTADILTYLEGATTFIDTMLQVGSVLVHCEQGMSRSAAVVMAYLMRSAKNGVEMMTRDEAFVVCKTKRPMVNPNEGFWKQLEAYETILNTEKSKSTTGGNTTIATSTDEESMKQWARRTQALFATCREIPQVLQTHNCWRLVESIQGESSSSSPITIKLLSICLDYVWGRGVRDEDIDWLLFVCDQFPPHDATQPQPRAILRDIINDPESEFSEAWSGEIDHNDKSKILEALD